MNHSENPFVHLHLHTQYSMLDGAIKIPDLMETLKKQGVNQCAITDHGSMFGIVDFYRQALKNGIKPIIGCEVYVAPRDRTMKEKVEGDDKNYHLILLAKNNTGLKNLQKLVSSAQLDGFFYKPRIDKDQLRDHSAGLIGLSACLGGEPAQHILAGNYTAARDAALEYQSILKEGDYYLELQENGIAEQTVVNQQLRNIAGETGIPLVATCDCHYLNKGDHLSHEVLMCIQMQTTLSAENRMRLHSEQLYVKSPDEMWEAFADDPEALRNTAAIADRCNVSIDFDSLHMPVFDVPDDYTAESYLEHLSREGLHKRLVGVSGDKHETYYKRMEFELDIITMKGYAGYYLVVWDFINYSRQNDIPVGPGRGSGAGSLVAYALGITDVDPMRFNLLFERFLNPERESMPDFDIDFCVNLRDKVIEYVRDKYGADRVAQIVTYGKLLGRSVVRDVGRVLEVPLSVVNQLAKAVPEAPGMTLKKALGVDPNLPKTFNAVERGAELFTHAQKLEGLIRQAGVHAAGVVIADAPLVEYVPLCRGQNGEAVTQFEKDTLESVGLVKFDFLGLKNLTIIAEAVKRIRITHDAKFSIDTIPLDDDKSYELLCRGDTTGVFQLESAGMKNLLKKLKPTVFEDIIALVALYRPGPINSGMLDDFVMRKHGQQKVTYPLPELEEILQETYGIIVYQEQVMQIAQVVAGYSLGSADLLRRAMGKKKPEEMAKHKTIFLHGDEKLGIKGAAEKGFDAQIAESIFDLMEKFAEYGFNKSHSAAYAVIAYQTAFLKANYPVEYMAALLSCELDKGDKVVTFIEECKRMDINVLPPDINESNRDFTIHGDTIRFGLGAIKNVGFGAIDEIIEKRIAGEPFTSIYDFCERVDLRAANKKVVEALIKAGTFDAFGKNRRQMLQVLDAAADNGSRRQKMREVGIMSLEDFLEDEEEGEPAEEHYPDVDEMPENELLKFEKEMLGFYVSNHPLATYTGILDTFTVPSAIAVEQQDSTDVVLGGLVKAVKIHYTKKGDRMAFLTLEDLEGIVEVVIFPKVYEQVSQYLEDDNIVVVKGKVSRKDEERTSVLADEVYDVTDALSGLSSNITIRLSAIGFTDDRLEDLARVISRFRGPLPVRLCVDKPGAYTATIALDSEFSIQPTFEFFRQLDDLLGEGRFELTPKNGIVHIPATDIPGMNGDEDADTAEANA